MKKGITIILLALLLLSVPACAYADTGIGIEPGETVPDFTVSLTDGSSATLSSLLKEKDLVVLNIFASWCGPCEREFPEMENVYRQKKDRMEIVSVSAEPNDTMELIADYKAGHGLSFPMGLAGDGLPFLKVSSFPTTIFIDKYGHAGLVKIGAFLSQEEFEEKVDFFLSPDYDGKALEAEKAVSLIPYLLICFVIGTILITIGRWRIFRKAGKKGWHSLVPFLNSYQEYSICWTGWIGLAVEACTWLSYAAGMAGLPRAVGSALQAVGFAASIPEGLKLAKAFGKGKVFGVLLAIPFFKELLRFILGVSKARYLGPGSEASEE